MEKQEGVEKKLTEWEKKQPLAKMLAYAVVCQHGLAYAGTALHMPAYANKY